MKIWLTTDTHFGHEKMIKLCGRPRDFDGLILKGLKEVPRDAILIHLGDFCIGSDELWHQAFMAATKQCKRRILVRGNHDHKSTSWYLDHGWDWVCDRILLECFGVNILFSHAPVVELQPLGIDLNIHGHLHNTGHHPDANRIAMKSKLLAIENTDYKPVNLEKFISNSNQK